ncbi:MAG: M24 family metallopeptidase [Bdellovibrionales bacterium]|jgi:Xaa-Pro aminopeptidase|nr:M24 family metallopeptidase [Bdellovibrionales bacterium]
MNEKFSLDKNEIENNINEIHKLLIEESLDAIYITSSDIFLSEYVPLQECLRYYVTGFTGSTAELLLLKTGEVVLFVDGRYHEQADLEVNAELVTVHKCLMGKRPSEDFLIYLDNNNLKTVGVIPSRTSKKMSDLISENHELRMVSESKVGDRIKLTKYQKQSEVRSLSLDIVGESTAEKIKRIAGNNSGVFISSLDSIAWVSNMRSFQLPFQSTFMAKAFFNQDNLFLFVLSDTKDSFPQIKLDSIKIIEIDSWDNIQQYLQKVTSGDVYETIYFDSSNLTSLDYHCLVNIFGEQKLIDQPKMMIKHHSMKNEYEMKAIVSSFNNADEAIYNTIKQIKGDFESKDKISELDCYNTANEIYKEGGAKAQSFKTIMGVGPNSSIIHYSTPSPTVILKDGDLVLMDSGGYYESGYATDTTRTFTVGSKTPASIYIEIYTLVLKGLLNAMNAVFPIGTTGNTIDEITRGPLQDKGYDYSHGTGHGVGINVHEGNYLIAPKSKVPLQLGTIGSIEPGIYIPEIGGVRLENVVSVINHPNQEGMLMFNPLVYIGFDHSLIDLSMLSDDEKVMLDDYEQECLKRNRSFKV